VQITVASGDASAFSSIASRFFVAVSVDMWARRRRALKASADWWAASLPMALSCENTQVPRVKVFAQHKLQSSPSRSNRRKRHGFLLIHSLLQPSVQVFGPPPFTAPVHWGWKRTEQNGLGGRYGNRIVCTLQMRAISIGMLSSPREIGTRPRAGSRMAIPHLSWFPVRFALMARSTPIRSSLKYAPWLLTLALLGCSPGCSP
jgi:hypothetical protein